MVGALLLASCSNEKGTVTVKVPADGPKQLIVTHGLVSDMLNAKTQDDLNLITDTLDVSNGKATLKIDERGNARYIIQVSQIGGIDFYTRPGESLTVNVTSYDPLDYTVAGSKLMEDATKLRKITEPLMRDYIALAQKGQPSMEEIQNFMQGYEKAVVDFIKANPKSPAVPYAMFDLEGESLKNAFDSISPEAKNSILYPLIEKQMQRGNEQAEEMKALEEKRDALNGTAAPGFTLKDLQGKNVSLSDFKGKWVVLDFWGSWCGWCIKGFPKLKEAYKEYAGKLEVIGIDCNESEEDWRDGVAKHELPWVNVYNPSDSSLLNDYLISGFPTKVIVNPEGKIANITVGEDPSFFDTLSSLINGK